MGPGLAGLLREARVIRELLAFAGDTARRRAERTPHRGSKPVLLVPGFMAGDTSLYGIAGRLRMAGYRVFFPGIWFNADCPVKTIGRLERVLRDAGRQTNAKVIIIGHSLGGIYARELARRFPLLVERAILLGSPLKDPVRNSNHLLRLGAAILGLGNHRCLTALGDPCGPCGLNLPGKSPKVPETIVYTKSDGIVDWRSCLESGPNVETIEVQSSHCGLAVSAPVCDLIIDRLAKVPVRTVETPGVGAELKYRLFRLRRRPGSSSVEAGGRIAARPAINRVEVADRLRCGICGSEFTADPAGDRTLVLNMSAARRPYYFCRECGDNITRRVQSNDARKRYAWYWAMPLDGAIASDGAA